MSASELLMNIGMLATAKVKLSATTQIHEKATEHGRDDGNSGAVAKQIESEHIPTLENNIIHGLERYIDHLTDQEARPFRCLLPSEANPSSSRFTLKLKAIAIWCLRHIWQLAFALIIAIFSKLII